MSCVTCQYCLLSTVHLYCFTVYCLLSTAYCLLCELKCLLLYYSTPVQTLQTCLFLSVQLGASQRVTFKQGGHMAMAQLTSGHGKNQNSDHCRIGWSSDCVISKLLGIWGESTLPDVYHHVIDLVFVAIENLKLAEATLKHS